MTLHEVVYFNGKGRGEAVRICLYLASLEEASKVEFKDTRIEFKDWPSLKPATPLGSLPLMKVDGFDHVQSSSLARYAAKLAGLYPSDPLQALFVDEVMDTVSELTSAIPNSPDEEEKKKLREEFVGTKLKRFAGFIESVIQSNTNGKGVVSTTSVADLVVKAAVDMIQSGFIDYVDKDFFNTYPGIIATAQAVDNNDSIKAYYTSLEK